MDPNDSTSLLTLESPNYPSKYDNNVECEWLIKTTSGSKITLVFDSFALQGGKGCAKDYLYVGKVAKYGRVQLCGTRMPTNFSLKSKKTQMLLIFKTDGSKVKTGFRASLVAA